MALSEKNRQIAKDYKKYKSETEKQMDDLKRENFQLKNQRLAGSPKNKYDRRAQENLAEEQLRLALEERLKYMWHPDQIQERFVFDLRNLCYYFNIMSSFYYLSL